MNIQQRIKNNHEKIVGIARMHGAMSVKLFGSAARGEATHTSDVDVLVTMKSGATLLNIIAIKQDLEDLLGCTVDVVTEDALSPYIKESVLKEAIRL